jgi:hypothetical protein
MKWCCEVFESHYKRAGTRGFALLVERSPTGKPRFVLQHRALDKGFEETVTSEAASISVVSDVVIQHCPWCGRRLDKWYGRSADALFRSGLRVPIPGLDG